MNGNMADSNGEREASEGSLRTSRKVFEAILVGEQHLLVVFREEARDRVFFLESK